MGEETTREKSGLATSSRNQYLDTEQKHQASMIYQQLLADVRRELAEEYIERSDLSVNEIAYMLGFSDCSNFARSFRRWMGTSPSEYRENKRSP